MTKEEHNAYMKQWHEKNKEHEKEYRESHRVQHQQWHSAHPEYQKQQRHEKGISVRYNNKRDKEYIKLTPVDAKRIYNKRYVTKILNTPKGHLGRVMSNCIHRALTKGTKAGRHWERLVGYTIGQLMEHLEKQFCSGMSWGNYGQWHIDHKTPICVFNFKTPEDIDFKKAWALENLQPLWAVDNRKKHAKLERPFQPSLAFAINY